MAELKDDATHEDIEAYVSQVVQNLEARDGEQLAAESDTPTGDVTNVAEDQTGEEQTAAKGEKTEWLDDDLKAELAAYGIAEQELSEFTSREEVERSLRLFGKQALEAGRQALGDQEQSRGRDERGRFAKSEQQQEEVPIEPQEGTFEIKLDKNIYDDGLVDELTRMRDHYESRLSALETRLLETDARVEEERFDTLVDELGHADLFGKTGQESKQELARRQELFFAWKAYQRGLTDYGREFDPESLLGPLAKMVFPEELDKKLLKLQTRRIARQSSRRQGGGVTRPTDAPETLRQEMRRLYEELEGSSS